MSPLERGKIDPRRSRRLGAGHTVRRMILDAIGDNGSIRYISGSSASLSGVMGGSDDADTVHTLLDSDVHIDTTTAAPVRGALIYCDVSGTWKLLSPPVEPSTLTFDGSDVAWSSAAAILAHTELSDMPDVAGTNSDHDARYYTESEIDTMLSGLTNFWQRTLTVVELLNAGDILRLNVSEELQLVDNVLRVFKSGDDPDTAYSSITVQHDGIYFGAGGASPLDTPLTRWAAGILSLVGALFIDGSGSVAGAVILGDGTDPTEPSIAGHIALFQDGEILFTKAHDTTVRQVAYTSDIPAADDKKVMVSAADTTPNYLYSKLTSSGSVTLTIGSAGGNEKVNIDVPTIPAADDHKAMVTSVDSTPDYLASKLTASGQASWSTTGGSGTNQKFNLDVPAAEVTLTNTATLTNKRITARVQSVTSNANVTPDADANDCVDITAQAAGLTIKNHSGTPTNFQKLLIRIKDNGSARTIAFESNYVAGGVALPTTTVAGKILTLGFIYNTANSLNKWQLVASAQEA